MGSQWEARMFALAVLWLSGCLCAWGQNTGSQQPATPPSAPHPPAMGTRRSVEGVSEMRWLSQQLNLTQDQKDKLRPVVIDEGDQLSAVRLDEHLPPDQKQAKMLEIREAFRPKIEAVLTPEQLEKLKKLQGTPQPQVPKSGSGEGAPAKPQ